MDLPEWGDRFDRIYGSSSDGNGDWVWRPTPSGGDAMIRRGGYFASGPVSRWPDGLEPLRFLALSDGTVGILAERAGALVWVELDGYLAATRERFLVACDGPCDVNVADVALLHDGALLVPTSRGWYIGERDWHFE